VLSLITGFFNARQGRNAISDAQRALEQGADASADIYGQYGGEANQHIDARALAAIARILGVSEDVAAQLLSTSEAGAQGIERSTEQANAGLNPYAQGGANAFTRLGDLVTKGPGPVNLEEDPGYQFRLQEGAKALERSAAARGGALGGAAMKAMARYSQGVASQEYQNAWDRSRADFDMQTKGLTNLADIGFNASAVQSRNTMTGGLAASDLRMRGAEGAGTVRMRGAEGANVLDQWRGQAISNNLMNVGRYQGDRRMDRAQATATGHVGRANAWSGWLNNMGRTLDAGVAGGFDGANWSWTGAARGAGRGY
jgi:hypothetical protein